MTTRAILCTLVCILAFALAATCPAQAQSFQEGTAALRRHDDIRAARIMAPLAERGDARAQTVLGFMYANGRGVPQSRSESALWYRRASEQGNATAQYMLGLMYDKGHGVPRDHVEAYKWLSLAVAGATQRERHYWVRVRDAVAFKLSPAELSDGQRLAIEWQTERRR